MNKETELKLHYEVVCAVISKDNKIFCCQRGPKGECAFKWEFPGGKIEPGETKEEALVREIKEELKSDIAKLSNNKNISINIKEVKRPDLDAELVAESIALQLEKRVSFRRAMKQAMQRVMKAGAVGCKIMVSGRLDGAEIARSEHYHEGRLPLHTIRADIDYATHEAHTTFGVVGVKVWICKGEILNKKAVTMDNTSNNGGADLC